MKDYRKHHRAFTLIELLLVLVILGVLAAIVVPRLGGQSEKARITATRLEITNLNNLISRFEMDMGRYPTSAEGLDALVDEPNDGASWEGPYIESERVPKDKWGNDYIYRFPSTLKEKGFDLFSVGPDGNEGTTDDISQYDEKDED